MSSSRLHNVRISRQLERSRAEAGFTVLEMLLAMLIASMVLVPVFGGMFLAMRSQTDASERNHIASSVGLLRSHLQRDAATAWAMLDSGDISPQQAPINTDCFGGQGAGQPVAIFRTFDENGDENKIVYTLSQTLDEGGTPVAGLWRRECRMTDPNALQAKSGAVEFFDDVALGAEEPRSICTEPGCPTLRLSVTPEATSTPAIITVSRRIGRETGIGDSSVSFGDLDVGITVDPADGPRPIDQEITFTADLAGGEVPDGHLIEWTLPGDTSATTESVQRQFTEKGRWFVIVRVTDPADGKFGSTMVWVTIGNEVPVPIVNCPGLEGAVGPDQDLERCEVPIGSHAFRGLDTYDPDREDPNSDGIRLCVWESYDPSIDEEDATVILNGNAGAPDPYRWEGCAVAQSLFTEPGLRHIRFTAEDYDGDKTSTLIPVLVSATDPVADLVGDPARVPTAGGSVTLTATAWFPDGTDKRETIQTLNWAMQSPTGGDATTWSTNMNDCNPSQPWGEGFACTTTVPKNFSAPSGSQQWVRVQAVSNFGRVSPAATYNVTTNTAPTADFAWSPTSPNGTTNVSFESLSTDDVGIETYRWDFGFWGRSGWTSTAAEPSKQLTPGKYQVKLTVTDAQSDSSTSSKTVIVTGTPPKPDRPRRHANDWVEWDPVPGAEKYEYQVRVRRTPFWCSDWTSGIRTYEPASADPHTWVDFDDKGACADYVYVKVRTVANGVHSEWSEESPDINE